MNHQRIKVLLVEDETAHARLVQEVLSEVVVLAFELTHVQQLKEALVRLSAENFDVLLLDLSLPDSQGLATYEAVHTQAPALPVIVLSGLDDEQLALQAVREGAQDYLAKGELGGRMLARVIRHAIERKRAAEALRQSEEFFRLISENVSDLVAVIDRDGRRLYNSPSYQSLLGDPTRLLGTDSFQEIHAEDRKEVRRVFQETLSSGVGMRTEYRMVLKDGSVRHIESRGSPIRDETGAISKLVVVSRDITERIEAVSVLRQALSDLNQSHAALKRAQLQLVESEKLEAVSTFAAGVAHEVKNPLQTVILGVDYLSHHLNATDATTAMVLADIASAVTRADGIIHGLLEFSSTRTCEIKDEDLSAIVEQSLRAIHEELVNHPITLLKDLDPALPCLRFDARTMKHVLINLCMRALREIPRGGKLAARTFCRKLAEDYRMDGRSSPLFKSGETVVGAAIENASPLPPDAKPGVAPSQSTEKESGLGLTVLKKIIELYGGALDVTNNKDKGNQYTILFKLSGRK